MKNHKGEIATLLTLGLVLVGTLVTLGSSFFVNKTKNIASNPKASTYCTFVDLSKCYDSGCKSPSKCSENCNIITEGGVEYTADCITTGSSTPFPTVIPNITTTKCGTNGAYVCDPALGFNPAWCKDKKGLEFGCWEKSSELFYGCIGTPCSKVTGVTLITESELKGLQNTQGYVSQCKGGSYVAEKDCWTHCGEGNCQSCKLGSYTTKYECKVSATVNLKQCGPETFWSVPNCQNKYGKTAKCTQCLIGISVAYEFNGSGPTQGAFPTLTPVGGSQQGELGQLCKNLRKIGNVFQGLCDPGLTCDQKTGRCVNRGGKTGISPNPTGGGKTGISPVPTGGATGAVSSNSDDQLCIDTFKTPYAYCGSGSCLKKVNVGGSQYDYKPTNYACKYLHHCCVREDMTVNLTLAPTNMTKPTSIPETNNEGDDQKCKDQFGPYSYCTKGIGCLGGEAIAGRNYEYQLDKYICNVNVGKDYHCCKLKDYQVGSSPVTTTTADVETSNGEKGKLINIPGIGKAFINF